MLQADSEKLRQAWVQAVQASIASAYRESPDSCYSEVRPRGLRAGVCGQGTRARAFAGAAGTCLGSGGGGGCGEAEAGAPRG